VLFFLALSIFFSLLYYTIRLGISPMPTSFRVLRKMDQILPERVEGAIVEMGSGWGHVAFFLARKYKAAQVIGYEKSWVPFLISKLVFLGQKNLQFKRVDFRNVSIEEAELVYCYLFPGAMEVIARKKRKGVLISNTFFLPQGKIKKEIELFDLFQTKIYIYQ
jgi:hypothetical protein